jgi:hypothetical protein
MSFGSQRGFGYTDDQGEIYGLRADESNVELVNPSPAATPVGATALPRDMTPRRIKLVSGDGHTKLIPVLLVSTYNLISEGDTFAAPAVGEENPAATAFVVQSKIPQRVKRRVTSVDTGLTDGDQP